MVWCSMQLFTKSWVWGLVFAAACLAVFSLMALNGFPGLPDDCVTDLNGNCYCEAYTSPAVEPTGVRQPASTLSALTPIVFGAAILFWLDLARGSTANPMAFRSTYSMLYGFLVIFLGIGSIYFHGSLTRIGGFVDNFSMLLYITFLIVYNLFRVRMIDTRPIYFVVLLFLLNSILAIPVYVIDDLGTALFAALVIVYIVIEVWIIATAPGGVRRKPVWFIVSVAAFAVAMIVWRLSWTGGAWCDPDSLLQGHALWHVLSMAIAPTLVFIYLKTETRPPTYYESPADTA